MQLLLLAPLLLTPLLGLSLGALAPKERRPRRQSTVWGPWGEWSPCSRTCGGGISFRERPCFSHRQDGGASCVGPVRTHRTCNTESCPEGARDFRAEQCAEFDGTEFQGRRYKWLPYYGAPHRCALNCIPKGENFYYQHKEAVVDGTPCEPGTRDVCVDGSCRVVGCDHKLDSQKQEDKCLRCGGDGTTCSPVTGTFEASDLRRGYNQVLIIPMGATSIHIEEAAASRNFLAVKSIRGEYYLNGHWTIEAAGALPVASTILQYERGAEGDQAPERLHARGPTSEPLVIEVISQEANPGVHYEYYLPLDIPEVGFSWSHGSWGDCSAECGGGHQTRLVVCTSDNEVYPDHLCQRQPRPATRRTCSLQPCPQTKRWKTGPWTPCSASCGGGTQSRSVYCVSVSGTGDQEAINEAECAGLPGKPPATQACNLRRCTAWHSEPWGECSVSCGSGVRRRAVTCRGDEGSVLQATACPSDQPPLTERCVRDDCPLGYQAWQIGPWSPCSKSCGSGTRERRVRCALGPPSHCESLPLPRPTDSERCHSQPCRPPQEALSQQEVHTGPRDPRTSLGIWESPDSESRGQRRVAQGQPSAWSNPRGDRGPHFAALGPALSDLGPKDCRHSPHGCCPDGHTASLGPQWQGCPEVSCQHSRYGCCPDGVSEARGPQQTGCARPPGTDGAGNGLDLGAVRATAHRPQAQQNEASECRGSQFGCCYDNVVTAAGPLGEGCVGQPSYAYPVRCLLPSAHGSCADWAARWYFIATVGRCNRFWYGGCHGNANNFASEEACMSSCRGSQPGASVQSSAPGGGQQEANRHRLGATGQGQRDHEPGIGGNAGQPAPASRRPSHRVSLTVSQPSLVQAALGQFVQLFCPEDTPLTAGAGWHKDGQPVSSDRHKLQADGSLVISYLQAEDAGAYSCGSTRPGRGVQLRITGGSVAVQSETELRHSPQAKDPAQSHGVAGGLGDLSSSHPRPMARLRLDQNQPGVVDTSPGQRTRLTCRADSFPPPTIEWQKDGQPLSSPRHQQQPDGSLVISPVVEEDGGFYACVAFNGQDRDQRWVQLRVLGELTITRLSPTVTVSEGDTARLLCEVAGESVNIRWSRNGLPVRADGDRVHQSPDGTLVIYNSQARDEGSYTCSAYRGSQAVSRSTEVKVVAPAPAIQPRDPGKRECIDQPELANCELILQAQLCGNEYYSSFCCASCSRFQPHAQPIWQ
ncbi:papilin [Tenrec ecaudatus]|uniref:papilin n=1 Tax=Tenrec ecaudatus TaxID=94439 RepID=UPI003F5AB7B8